MNRREFIGCLALLGCKEEIEPMKASKIFASFISSSSTPWYLAGGAIPASTSYTIYDPLAASSQANSYINLANPGTRDANPVVAPSWGAGWTFNGTTQYIDTGMSFLSSHTIVCWHENWAGTYSFGNTKILSRPFLDPNSRFTLTGNTDLTGPSRNSIIALRAGSGIYRNGKKLSNLGAFPAGTDYSVFIACRNNAGTAANFGSGTILRYAHYDFALSDAQIEALTTTMQSYQAPAATAYESVVIGTSPVVYYPMTQKYAKFFVDRMGLKANAEFNGTGGLVGQEGPTDKGYSAKGSSSLSTLIQTQDTWAAETGINLNEFSFSCWVKNVNTDAQARPVNIYSNSGNEYWAIEIRTGTAAVYSKENGVTWNTTGVAFPNNTWTHLVGYNSLSAGKTGFYINGVKSDFTKGTSGFSDTSPDTYYPYFLQSMNGYMSHLAFYDHALSQAEVDALNV